MEPSKNNERSGRATPAPGANEVMADLTTTLLPTLDMEAQLARLRAEREELRKQMELESLQEEVNRLRRIREGVNLHHAGNTPAARVRDSDESIAPSDSATNYDEASHVQYAGETHATFQTGRPRLKEPSPYKGRTIKEARAFIKELEVIFALAKSSYQTEQDKVLYGVMFLAGEPYETWHHRYEVSNLGAYTFEDFRQFVLDAVEDPANRSITVTMSYEKAVQREGQSIASFASDLATIEEQMSPYTEEQRVRHLLAKITPDLRNEIIKYHEIPVTRQGLISLGARIESVDKRAPSKRDAPDSHDRSQRKRHLSSRSDLQPARPARAQKVERTETRERTSTFDKSQIECYGCGKKGHYKSECRSPHLWKKPDRVNKVVASASPAPHLRARRTALVNRVENPSPDTAS